MKRITFEQAVRELQEAYGTVQRRCADPPDELFEDLIDALEQAGPSAEVEDQFEAEADDEEYGVDE